jgi:hypothetical protein
MARKRKPYRNFIDGMRVVIVDKDTGEARVSWDGESAQLGLPARRDPLPMPPASLPLIPSRDEIVVATRDVTGYTKTRNVTG